MLIKSPSHDHFWTENRIVYETYLTIRGLRFRQIAELWFYYPDHKILTEPMIEYLNKRFAHKPEQKEPDKPEQDQYSLF